VLIAARAPAAFNMARGRFGPETGYVLYHLTFFKSEN
jgi:hypothetical protein